MLSNSTIIAYIVVLQKLQNTLINSIHISTKVEKVIKVGIKALRFRSLYTYRFLYEYAVDRLAIIITKLPEGIFC